MDRIQLRRDSSARWAEVNPVLLEGEVGFETDTKLRKIGDGVHRWNELEYLAAENVVQELGNSESAVVSQKVLTEKINEVEAELGKKYIFSIDKGEQYNTNIYAKDSEFEITSDNNSITASLYFINEDGSFISLGYIKAGETKKYTSEEKGNIRVYADYGLISGTVKIIGIKDKISRIDTKVNNISVTLHGELITATASKGESVNLKTCDAYTKFIIKNTGNIIFSVYFIRTDNTFVTLPQIAVGSSYEYISKEKGYIRFYADYGNINGECYIVGLNERFNEINSSFEKVSPKSVNILKRVGCIGDSYTKGFIWTKDGSYSDEEDYSWPKFMSDKTNNRWENFGYSGSTSKMWVTWNDIKKPILQEGNKCQAYIIGLMINDKTLDGKKYDVGVISDIGTDNDTYYAWYYKVVQMIAEINNNAPIFCLTCPQFDKDDVFNQAVRDIVSVCKTDRNNVFLCDLASDRYNNSNFYKNEVFISDAVNGHYTSIGYEFMAECFIKAISDVINENIIFFQNIHKVDYDK